MDKIYKIILGVLFFLAVPTTVGAADLYFVPSAGYYSVGDIIPVTINVSSSEQAMNAVSALLSFPADKMEVASISKVGSIVNLWPAEPSFSNQSGTVQFEGVVLNPGYTGAVGKIITINFKVKIEGSAEIYITSGSIFANDGKGTDITTGLGRVTFSLVKIKELGVKKVSSIAKVPLAPQVKSSTHPDSDKWYSNNEATFTWPVQKDVMAVSLTVDSFEDSIPSVNYEQVIGSKTVQELGDGIWYFHLRLKNSAGWGDTSHFRFQIDKTPPEPFSIIFLDGNESFSIRPRIAFDITDLQSGIASTEGRLKDENNLKLTADSLYYHIDDKNWFPLEEIKKGDIYILPEQKPGDHVLTIRALDLAGNMREENAHFSIVPNEVPTKYYYVSIITNIILFIVVGALIVFIVKTGRFRNRRL